MAKQLNVRSDRAYDLATDWSRRRRQPVTRVVEQAMVEFDQRHRPKVTEEELWGPLLKQAQAAVREANCDFRIEDLYDPETGLPA